MNKPPVPPSVSICMPTYNSGEFVLETLESISAQTYCDWELIVTDNGSIDDTETIVKRFVRTVNQSIIFKKNYHNLGLAGNRNAAIALARSEWVALLDSDDLWLPEHLETCMQVLSETGAELIHSGSQLFESTSRAFISLRAPSEEDISELPLSLFGLYIIQPSSVLISRELWHRAGWFDSSFVYGCEDIDMWLRCARAGASIVYTRRETLLYRKHDKALSINSRRMAGDVARAFDKHLSWTSIPLDFRLARCAKAWSDSARFQWRLNPKLAAVHFQRACSLQWKLTWFLHGMLCRCMAIMHFTVSN